MEKQPCVYLLASQHYGTLYTRVTSNLLKRVWEHKTHSVDGFTKKYDVTVLVWYEIHESMESAIKRKKSLKNWNQAWKIRLLEETNSQWRDLYKQLL
ncbi:GIY-YIG nuclease family protein [Thiohalophilus sp.]|uniref:GIY-YIG nuclease family protein n=1 Tax=Thiohalophilus sp. TaxID=3028392 RepID=UPI0039767D2C